MRVEVLGGVGYRIRNDGQICSRFGGLWLVVNVTIGMGV